MFFLIFMFKGVYFSDIYNRTNKKATQILVISPKLGLLL